MFTQSCFINKNTEELRDKLVKLGYKYLPSVIRNRNEMLFANRGYFSNNFPYNAMLIDESTDCGDNEELFLALTALRDDSDYMQYFIASESDKPTLCTKENIEDHTVWHELYRKMTAEELVDYFNKQNI